MTDSITTLADLFTQPQFLIGLVAGVVALMVGVVLKGGHRNLDWASAFTVCVVLGIHFTVGQRLGVVMGLATLSVGGWLLDRARVNSDSSVPASGAWLVLAAGAFIVTVRGGLPGDGWVTYLTPLVTLGIGAVIASWNDVPRRGLIGPLLAITVFGIWTTVPDTDSARVLLGAALPLALVTPGGDRFKITAIGAFPLGAVISWIAADGGGGRPGSIVGAWACIGLIALIPLLKIDTERFAPWTIVIGHSAFVVLSARVFGLWESTLAASIGVAMVALITAWILRTMDQARQVRRLEPDRF